MTQLIKLTAIIIISVATFFSVAQAQSRTTFNGTWQINLSKSKFDSLKTDLAPKELKVSQAGDSVAIAKWFVKLDGKENRFSETFYNNGRITERQIPPTTRRETSIVWSEKKDTLIINAKSFVNDKGLEWEYNTTEYWTLTPDSKQLKVYRKAVMPDRTEVYQAVYEKQ